MPLGNPIRKQNESRMVSVLATEGQTVFTVQGGYIINHISVFRNGVRLSPAEDFTAGDGSTVTLNNAANIDDRIDFHIFDRFTVQNAIVSAASTQTISGDVVVNGKIFGNLDVPSINTGIVTATELDLVGVTTVGKQVHVGTGVSIAAGGLNVTAGISTFQAVQGTTGTFSSNLTASGASNVLGNTTINGGGGAGGAALTIDYSGTDIFKVVNTGKATITGDVSIADKIIHTGDTNTAIRFPAADTFTVETAGSERFRIASGGSIGIINTSPGSQYYNHLVVGNNDSGDKGITIRSNSGNEGVLAFSDTDAATSARYAGKIAYNHSANAMIFYTTAGDERLRIDTNGHVMTSGNTQLFGSNTSDGSDNKSIMINGGGDITDARGGYLLVHGNEHSSNPGITRLHAGNVTDAHIAFNTSGAERMQIRAWGDVHLAQKLNVAGISTFGGNLYVTGEVRPTSNLVMNSADNQTIYLGASNDLQIVHNGSDSHITDSGTGSLALGGSAIFIQNAAHNANMASFVAGAEANLFHNGIKKFTTLSSGAKVLGSEGGDAELQIAADEGDDNADFFRLYKPAGSNSFYIQTYAAGSWENCVEFSNTLQALYYANSSRLYTTLEGFGMPSGTAQARFDERGQPTTSSGNTHNTNVYWKVGEIRAANGSQGGQVNFYGTQSYSSGYNTAGKTVLVYRVETSNNLSGYWYSETHTGAATASDIRWKHDGSDVYSVWIKKASYDNVIPYAEGNGNWKSFGTSTGDGNAPSGSTAFTPKYQLVTGGHTTLESNANGAFIAKYQGTSRLDTNSSGITIFGGNGSGRVLPGTNGQGYIGESANKWNAIYATNGTIQTSDRNEKNTIIESDLGLDFIKKLKPISYKWNKEDDNRTHYGLIAQDVEEALLTEGKTDQDFAGFEKPTEGALGLSYTELISPLIKAIQEQQEQIETLKAEVAALKGS